MKYINSKELGLLKMFLIIFFLLNSGFKSFNRQTDAFNSISEEKTYSAKAYINYGGNWHEGTIQYSKTDNVYKPLRWYFPDVNLNGWINQGNFIQQSFTALNPNNPLAIENNFTHYIAIQGINAFLTLN